MAVAILGAKYLNLKRLTKAPYIKALHEALHKAPHKVLHTKALREALHEALHKAFI